MLYYYHCKCQALHSYMAPNKNLAVNNVILKAFEALTCACTEVIVFPLRILLLLSEEELKLKLNYYTSAFKTLFKNC